MLYTIIDDTLDIIDLKNGTLLQKIETEGFFPSFTKNTIYLHTLDNKIIVFSSEKMVAPHSIKVAQSAIDASKDKVNVADAQGLLERAKGALAREDYSNAIKYAKEAKENAILPFITAAEKSISWCNFLHADAPEAENLLKDAKRAYVNGYFLDSIKQAIEAKESSDEVMKTRLMKYIALVLVSAFAITLLYRFGMLKEITAFVKVHPLTLIFSTIISLSIFVYLLLSAY
ncbi:MAG: hypothetical protein DRG69_04780, partial [Deltaproteobacteria bacterium]